MTKGDVLVNDDIYPLVSMRTLEFMLHRDRSELRSIAATVGKDYRPFDFRRPGSEKWRHIDNPVGALRSVQRAIHKGLLSEVHFPDLMFGGIRGRSSRANAEIHIGRGVVATLDLKDCFPNITPTKVNGAWITIFGCSQEIASLLTKLTTVRHRLPQGAPTSTLLANLVLLPVYMDVKRIAEDHGLDFSFFLDDIAVSGDAVTHEIIGEIINVIHAHGFAVSRKKLRIMRRGSPQRITGVTVNKKASAGRARIAEIRHEILTTAAKQSVTLAEVARLWGKIYNVTHTCPEQGAALKRFANRVLPDGVAQGDSVAGASAHSVESSWRRCQSYARHRQKQLPLRTVAR
jgi:RNA-directed DNA polymerase